MTAVGPARFLELSGAVVAHEVVARQDVVDPEAVGAGKPLARVALEQALAVQAGVAPAVVEEAAPRLPAAGLAGRGRMHPLLFTTRTAGAACDLPTGRYNGGFQHLRIPEPLDGASA